MKRLSIAFLVVIGVVSSSLPSLVMAQTLNITLSSYQGPPETAVTIRGGGATPNTDVVVLFAYFQAPPDNCYRGRGATGNLRRSFRRERRLFCYTCGTATPVYGLGRCICGKGR